MNRTSAKAVLAALPLALLATQLQAHTGDGSITGGFVSGFVHPIFGWDHVVAMIAVGLWGTFLGNSAIWLLPVVFPLVMAVGGAFGVLGVPLPAVEVGIALSGLVLGLMVAFAVRVPLWAAGLMVAVFAVFHGHAHGAELPEASNPYAFGIGFVVATGLLHLSGIALGFATRVPLGVYAVRAAGAVIAAVGGAFLIGAA